MKYFIYIINCLLVIMIPVAFVITPTSTVITKSKAIKTEVEVKRLQSGDFTDIITVKDEKTSTDEEVVEEKVDESTKEQETKPVSKVEISKEETKAEEAKKEEPIQVSKPTTDVLETQTGKMSGYGPDCKGCSGYLASGKYVGNGTIYYNDPTYGQVRIVAGDYSYKFGTIVRIKNSRVGQSFTAIVLDRGGSIGFGKKFLFDLLYSSEQEALKDEVSYNVTFEILRYGY